MDKNMKLFAGILVFGSLWGFSEIFLGSMLKDAGLPYGAIMTGFFVLTFLVLSRMFYRQPGMQLYGGISLPYTAFGEFAVVIWTAQSSRNVVTYHCTGVGRNFVAKCSQEFIHRLAQKTARQVP